MTCNETTCELRRIADALDEIGGTTNIKRWSDYVLNGPIAVGAASMLVMLRDLLTISPIEVYSREKILVLLETLSRDNEIFPAGLGKLMWDMEDDV